VRCCCCDCYSRDSLYCVILQLALVGVEVTFTERVCGCNLRLMYLLVSRIVAVFRAAYARVVRVTNGNLF
jgi:hypothetical protein